MITLCVIILLAVLLLKLTAGAVVGVIGAVASLAWQLILLGWSILWGLGTVAAWLILAALAVVVMLAPGLFTVVLLAGAALMLARKALAGEATRPPATPLPGVAVPPARAGACDEAFFAARRQRFDRLSHRLDAIHGRAMAS